MEESIRVGRDGQSTMGHFRESDIEFLRGQAKEWLEAVLGEDLDDNSSLEDLLADGSLLYRVSQHVNDIKFPGHVESGLHSVAVSPSMEKKNSMKYQPYASVEAFLKVCKEVGLQDLDVFNPSDAVDKKDIRRVCVCLRRFSKKARTLGIQVPDFDNVKDTVVTPGKMPRDAVRRTQESLQLSSSSSPKSSSLIGLVSNDTSSLIGESESLKPSEKGGAYNKVDHDLDVAAEHRESEVTDSNYIVKVAEPSTGREPNVTNQVDDKEYDKNESSTWLLLLGGAAALAGGVAGLLFLKNRSGNDDHSEDEGHTSMNLYSAGLYKVREGDSLTVIARKSGKKHWREIAERNPRIDNPNLIYPGDRLEL